MVTAKAAATRRGASHRTRPTFSRRPSAETTNRNTRPPSRADSEDSNDSLSPTFSTTSADSSVCPSIHDLLAASLVKFDDAPKVVSTKRRRVYEAYDRFGAIVTIPLSNVRSAEEALEEDNLLEDADEWEDEDGPSASDDKQRQLSFKLDAFVEEAAKHVGPITGMAFFAKGIYHQVFVVRTASACYAARFDVSEDKPAAQRRLEREIATMQLACDAGAPVPRVHAYNPRGAITAVGAAWMLMQWCEGVDRPYAYLAEREDKDMHIRWLAKTMVSLFEAPISDQSIGSIASYDGKTCTVSPSDNLIAAPNQQDADQPESLASYLDWLCERACSTTAGTDFCTLSRHESSQLVSRFRRLISAALDALEAGLSKDEIASLHRIALVHGDPDRNVLAPAGSPVISAIIDFEFSLCLPAVLAATYPIVISREGIRNERHHVSETHLLRGMVWDESSSRSAKLRRLFDGAVAELSPAYHLALQRGRRLRDIADWLTNWEHDDGYRACAASFVEEMELECGIKLKSSLSTRSLGSLGALSR